MAEPENIEFKYNTLGVVNYTQGTSGYGPFGCLGYYTEGDEILTIPITTYKTDDDELDSQEELEERATQLEADLKQIEQLFAQIKAMFDKRIESIDTRICKLEKVKT